MIKKLEKQIRDKESRRSELFKLKEPIDKELESLYEDIKNLKEEITKAKLKQEMSFEEKFEYLMFEDGIGSDMERYNAAQKMLSDMGFHMGGYSPHSNQKCVQLMLYKGVNDNLKEVYDNFTKILPLIKPNTDKGEKRFKLFEHTLSEDGVYELVFDGNMIKLVVWRYHRESMIKEWDKLKDALLYCQEYHYYESSLDDDNDW